jgi:hypothetical protein
MLETPFCPPKKRHSLLFEVVSQMRKSGHGRRQEERGRSAAPNGNDKRTRGIAAVRHNGTHGEVQFRGLFPAKWRT